ncbi:DUF6624 domain-containing protein [Oryzobacter terrae]|uniref:DUF6624 domain-containing protein n=1 Tax=Oryzobacter terrae TaxID=1620385 RepID=UPI00367117E5
MGQGRDRTALRVGRTAGALGAVIAAVAVMAAGCSVRTDDPRSGSPSTTASASSSASPSGSPGVSRAPAPAPSIIDKPPTTAPVAEPELRTELLAMLVQDQAVRTGVAPPGDARTAGELAGDWDETDRRNNARMAEILDEHGWPGWRLVGSDGAFAAWVLVQHADLDVPLQERGLTLMTTAVEQGDADPSDHAYLVDRVRVAKGEPQAYGTQWGADATGKPEPRTPIEDEAQVDVRRAKVGLGTIDAYLEELASME